MAKKKAAKKVAKKTTKKAAAKKATTKKKASKKVAKKAATKKKTAKKAVTKKASSKKKVAKKAATKKKTAKKVTAKKAPVKKATKKAATKKTAAKKTTKKAAEKKVAKKTVTKKTATKKTTKKTSATKTKSKEVEEATSKAAKAPEPEEKKREEAPAPVEKKKAAKKTTKTKTLDPLEQKRKDILESEDVEEKLSNLTIEELAALDPDLEILVDDDEDDIVLMDAEGRPYCKVKDCDELASVDGYCRFHYIFHWRRIQARKKILAGGKLDRYIEELTARYPDKYLEMLRKDLLTEKDFMAVVDELEIEDGSMDDFDDDSKEYIEEMRGLGGDKSNNDDDY